MNEETETVKIKTTSGMILTLKIIQRSKHSIFGLDKFDAPVLLQLSEIHSMIPVRK